jgi:hypothetical protein
MVLRDDIEIGIDLLEYGGEVGFHFPAQIAALSGEEDITQRERAHDLSSLEQKPFGQSGQGLLNIL